MKTNKCSIIVISMIAGMVACNKGDKAIAPASEKGQEMIANLVEDMHKETTPEDAQAIAEKYAALSAGELEQFFVLKNERDTKAYEAMQMAGRSNLSEADKNLIKEKANAVADFRMSLLKLSVERLGQPMNKISPEQFNALANEILKDKKYDILDENPEPAAKEDAVLACPQVYYPTNATQITFSGGIGYYSVPRFDNDPNANPCDFEHRFDGDYRYIRGERGADVIALTPNPAKRSLFFTDGIDTGILLGYNHWLALLYPGNLHARMTN